MLGWFSSQDVQVIVGLLSMLGLVVAIMFLVFRKLGILDFGHLISRNNKTSNPANIGCRDPECQKIVVTTETEIVNLKSLVKSHHIDQSKKWDEYKKEQIRQWDIIKEFTDKMGELSNSVSSLTVKVDNLRNG